MNEWVVVQNAGFTNERVVYEASSYDDAYCAMDEQYQSAEQDELHVEVLRRLPDGTLDSEY